MNNPFRIAIYAVVAFFVGVGLANIVTSKEREITEISTCTKIEVLADTFIREGLGSTNTLYFDDPDEVVTIIDGIETHAGKYPYGDLKQLTKVVFLVSIQGGAYIFFYGPDGCQVDGHATITSLTLRKMMYDIGFNDDEFLKSRNHKISEFGRLY